MKKLFNVTEFGSFELSIEADLDWTDEKGNNLKDMAMCYADFYSNIAIDFNDEEEWLNDYLRYAAVQYAYAAMEVGYNYSVYSVLKIFAGPNVEARCLFDGKYGIVLKEIDINLPEESNFVVTEVEEKAPA